MKTKTTHTPGPWKFDGGLYVRFGDWPVATINGAVVEREANARLIAAAPELLAALIRITGLMSCDRPDFCKPGHIDECPTCQGRAVIAEAEGR